MMPNLTPLSEQFRPQSVDEIVGQDHLVGKRGFITRLIERQHPVSILLWGPPGSGKTSIARLYAKAFNIRFETMSAIFSGVADLRALLKSIEDTPLLGRHVMLFVDEIHRFNKSQQDAFLPYLENGKILLIGATVENPSYYLNPALLSRLRVLEVKPLTEEALEILAARYEMKYGPLPLTPESRKILLEMAQGDGRYLFNLIENISAVSPNTVLDPKALSEVLQHKAALYDRQGEQHYNLISALHKSVRGSDPHATLYWLARMIEGGEDPYFISRRLIRMASEDIGLADPQALVIANAAWDTYERLGSPEGELAFAQAAVYMALAPKSNAIYEGFNQAREAARQSTHLAPPKHILNAPTRVMKSLGYGEGYVYDHDTPYGISAQHYFPDEMSFEAFYHPKARGFERDLIKRIEFIAQIKKWPPKGGR